MFSFNISAQPEEGTQVTVDLHIHVGPEIKPEVVGRGVILRLFRVCLVLSSLIHHIHVGVKLYSLVSSSYIQVHPLHQREGFHVHVVPIIIWIQGSILTRSEVFYLFTRELIPEAGDFSGIIIILDGFVS